MSRAISPAPPRVVIKHRLIDQRQDQCPQQLGNLYHRRALRQAGGLGRGDIERAHFEITANDDAVARPGGQVDGAVRRHDPRLGLSFDAHDARNRVQQLVARVLVRRNLEAGRKGLCHCRYGARQCLVIVRVGAAVRPQGIEGRHAAILKGQWQKVDVLWQDIGIPTRAK